MQGIVAENVYGKTSCDSQGVVLQTSLADPVSKPPLMEPQWWSKSGTKLDCHEGPQKVGYGGFVPRIYAENVHGNTFAGAQSTAANFSSVAGNLGPSMCSPQTRPDPVALVDVEPNAGAPLEPVLDSGRQPPAQADHSQAEQVPGYGGYIPGIYAKGVFGATFENAQIQARTRVQSDNKPRAAPRDFTKKTYERPKDQLAEVIVLLLAANLLAPVTDSVS